MNNLSTQHSRLTTRKIACIQLTSGSDMGANIAKAGELIARAAGQGAQLIGAPENVFLMEAPGEARVFYSQENHPGIVAAKGWAKTLGVWILLGSVAVRGSGIGDRGSEKNFNRSILINPQGEIAAHYDKIHLFDVTLASGEVYAESARFLAGAKSMLASISPSPLRGEGGVGVMVPQTLNPPLTPCLTLPPQGGEDIKLGMTVCYDVRFPHLYRSLAKAGAQILAVPSAFTQTTGEAHWHVLLRARAIENGCFVMAPAQTGTHPGGRKTYGHALIIDPWGKVLADAGTEEGVIVAEIDLNLVAQTRARLPSLEHDREFL